MQNRKATVIRKIMQTKVLEKQGLKRKLEFMVPAEDVNAMFEKSLKSFQKTTRLPGFRPGKAPLQAVRKICAEKIYESTADRLFQNFYPKALAQNKLSPVGPANLIEIDLKENKDARFVFSIEIFPKLEHVKHKNLKIKESKDKQPGPEDLEKALVILREAFSQFEDSPDNKGPAKEGDFLLVGLKVFSRLEGKELKLKKPQTLIKIQKTDPEHDTFILGEHAKGLCLNEEREFGVRFPKRFIEADVAGQDCRVIIRVLGFKKLKPPKGGDEELAKQAGFSSLSDMKAYIKENIERRFAEERNQNREESVLRLLREKNPIEIPSTLIKEQKKEMMAQIKKKMIELNTSPEQRKAVLLEKESKFEQEAKDILHEAYLIEKLATDWDIQATPKEIEAFLKEKSPNKNLQDIKRALETDKIHHIITAVRRKKALKRLVETVEISTV